MGKPVANQEFLCALLRYGTFESYHFYCDDTHHLDQFHTALEQILDRDGRKRVKLAHKALFAEQMRSAPLDVLHHGDFTYYMPYLIELRNRMGFPFPVSGVTHSLDGVWMQTRLIQLLLADPSPGDTIVCTSSCAREQLASAFGEIRGSFAERFGTRLPEPPELSQIPLGIPERFFQAQERSSCREGLGIPSDHFVILSLARFSARHKMDLSPILEAFQWLKHEGALPEFTLVLAGAGKPADLSIVREMIARLDLQQEVRLETNVSPERKLLLYGAADTFLSMVDNFQETFGLTLIEAMAQGLPVVASDFNGYKDLVAHGRTGFLIPTSASMSFEPWSSVAGLLAPSLASFYLAQKVSFDFARLMESLTTLAHSPPMRREMGLRARARALRYRWQVIIPLYEEMWKNQKEKIDSSCNSRPKTAVHAPVLVPRIDRVFSHYPTALLTGDERIALTPYGRRRYRQGFQPILYEELNVLLKQECTELLVNLLLQEARNLSELIARAGQESDFSPETILAHLDWLMKHGCLSCQPPAPSG